MAHMHQAYQSMNSRTSMADTSGQRNLQEGTLWKMLLLCALIYLVWTDKIAIVFESPGSGAHRTASDGQGPRAATASLFSMAGDETPPNRSPRHASVEIDPDDFNTVTPAIDPGFTERNGLSSAEADKRLEACRAYVDRYAPVAVAEMHKFGIPASIILAQGLLESNAGQSNMARKINNHFGVKCFSKSCPAGHCANFSDDSHKDFFVKYNNVWGSYRGHSLFLKNTARYKNLFKLGSGNYEAWAKGLAKAGYASDKHYGVKLIAIIQNLDLGQYDRQ